MCKERNSNRRAYLTCFFGIAVMALSLWIAGVGTANANYEDGSGDGEWLFPGEYESHLAIWMLWPTYENKAGFPSTEPISDMIRAMSGYVHVNLAVQDAEEEAAVRSLLTAGGVRLDHVHFFQIEHLDIWARDMGPQFTRSRSGRLRINDWNFNYWGNEEPESFNSTFEEGIVGVWPASYVNYVPTNDLVLVPKFWKPGRSLETWKRDNEARAILKELFPGRRVAQVNAENVIRDGGGMNCITQQQPASAKFARMCGWAKVQVTAETATLYAEPVGEAALGSIPRVSRFGDDIYLKRLSSSGKRLQVRVVGISRLNGETWWVDEDDIESAGEKCPLVYSPN